MRKIPSANQHGLNVTQALDIKDSNITLDVDVVIIGSGAGGATVVNGAVTFRTPDAILEKWNKEYGLTKINQVDGQVTGVSATVIDPQSKSKVASLLVHAKTVVSSAGAIQSPLLFLRSHIGNSSNLVGKT